MAKLREGKWSYESAIEMLGRNGIKPLDKDILLGRGDHPGLKVWGAIEYLKNYCGFKVRREG